MRCVDTTFCVDLSKGVPAAVARAEELDRIHERIGIPAPALAEFLIGGFAKGGRRLESAVDLISRMEVLPVDEEVALEAARIGGQAVREGRPVGTIDLLIAATARTRHCAIITRDQDFSGIPGLSIETY